MSCSQHTHCFTHYWQSDRRFQTWDNHELQSYLHTAGYHFEHNASHARLQSLCARAARGLMSYEGLTAPQLQRLCTRRKVSVPVKLTGRKLALRALLVAADERPRQFTKFTQLPTEIRVMIYSHHTKWLQTRLGSCDSQPARVADWSFVAPPPPPLARVSRQLRDEFLPEFYTAVNFRSIALPANPPHDLPPSGRAVLVGMYRRHHPIPRLGAL
ncbi:hypothetical protein CLAFUW4_04088 [Fulvia fulva]|uniref:2EXR domain-containing protein n=1 Tax=Passalora fulva TaxID=5499 RepID=A0A9Q8LFW2_PASFU|nr:uncharacterized protein CLAFUR5_04051 [Fulvia fulva]KAK4626094.1 hypothetical protein CLAFUR4_04074 [Fulvia fulva]KAK4627954.1 hypothetical protein CLAFUR0_04075 [Fulvia fulva]UJO16654.1 hypothetical protein CLAFUR5_04051 [Fulvia fulva]WPV13819.1 hypothetical protein CLAFUW4_04088 [Fulvia fulva]WPV29265.1 hypothetical protein CLAFUW7_04077 [Fulvia fulva]